MVQRSWIVPALLAVLISAANLPSRALFSQDRADEEGTAEDRQAALLFNTASRLYRQKNWREASGAFDDFLKRFPAHPDAPEARFARGYSRSRLGQHAAAAEDLKSALDGLGKGEAPWAAEAWFHHGRSLAALAAEKPEGSGEKRDGLRSAARSYGEAARLHGRSASRAAPPAPPGGREAEGGDPEGKAGKASPVELQALALTSQGEALYQGAFYREAVEALSPLAKEEKRFGGSTHLSHGLYLLALSRHALGDEAGASEILARVAGGNPKDPVSDEAAFFLARLLHRKGDRTKAMPLYDKVTERGRARAEEASLYRAIALYERQGAGDLEQAIEELSRLLARNPPPGIIPRARFYEALALFDRKRYDEAARKLEPLAREGEEHAGRARLRLGQALLLKEPPDPQSAARALETAVAALRKETEVSGGEGPGRDGRDGERSARSPDWAAEALYWQAEALLASGGEALGKAAQVFGEVAERHRESSPDLAEKSLYQEARSLHLSGNMKECAARCRRYRERYPEGGGRFYLESLKLSADCALRAARGELPEDDRRAAPALYREAASLAGDPAESRRLQYLSGVALYHQGAHREAAEVFSSVREASRAQPLPGFREPELLFYLADSLLQASVQSPGQDPAGVPESRKDRPEDPRRLKLAAELYRDYLSQDPGGPHAATALVNLGLCHSWLGEREAARDSFLLFLERHAGHPLSPQVRLELANLHLAGGDLEAASIEYRRAAGEAPEGELAEQALLQSVVLSRRRKSPEDALRALEELEKRSPSSSRAAEARLQLAGLHLESGEPEKALEALKPIEDSPGAAGKDHALYLRAWCFRRLAERKPERPPEKSGGKPAGEKKDDSPALRYRKEEEDAYRKLIEGHPRSAFRADAMLELAQRLFGRRERAEARKWFLAVLETAGKSAPEGAGGGQGEREGGTRVGGGLLEECLHGLGMIAFEGQDYRQARELLDRAAAGNGEIAPRALFHAGRAFMLSEGDAEAAERFERLLGDPGEKARELREEVLLRLGECRHRLRRFPEAVEALERMLREFPEGKLRHEGLFAMGYARQFQDDHEAASRAYRQVAAGTRAPVAARAQYHLGECLMDRGKHREAAREFLTVAANFDFDGPYQEWVRRALLGAGLAYQAAGDRESAAAQYEELVKRFPGSEEGRAGARRLAEVKR